MHWLHTMSNGESLRVQAGAARVSSDFLLSTKRWADVEDDGKLPDMPMM